MKKNNESGHSKNVANFQLLLSFCESYGTVYNPSSAALTLTSAKMLLTAAEASLATLQTETANFKNCINLRSELFDSLPKLYTSILSALDACGASENRIIDAKSIVNKLRGKRVGKIETLVPADPTTPPAEPVQHNSVSHLSFDSVLSNFNALIQLLLTEAKYQPNEASLSTGGLTAMAASLSNAHAAANAASIALSNARVERDRTLYLSENNLYEVAFGIKKYIKSLFGTASPEYKQTIGISFTNKPSSI
jgi:hypothetical protein